MVISRIQYHFAGMRLGNKATHDMEPGSITTVPSRGRACLAPCLYIDSTAPTCQASYGITRAVRWRVMHVQNPGSAKIKTGRWWLVRVSDGHSVQCVQGASRASRQAKGRRGRGGASRLSPAPSTTLKQNWIMADLEMPKPTSAVLRVFGNVTTTD
ncbi:hypothetical protein E2C01_005458 [Portunus trituberculatus]|uniref:Uncharacterized protein n=1 Tax=Portunus trituberculatus TaxID=210409 RepID=A0A5B7CSU3_PORTR|nr:hypothetical protein [Portunus trituberculatus]